MKELINATLLQNRHPIRAKAFIGMADVLIEAGFENRFVEVYGLISGSDSSAEIVEKLEEVIVQCAFNFFQRTGIIINIDNIYKKPVEANEIIQALIDGFDDFEDKDSLLMYLTDGEPANIQLGNACGFLYAKPACNFHDIIDDVLGPTVKAIVSVLNKNIEEHVNIDEVTDKLIVKYLTLYPNSVLAPFYNEYGYRKPLNEILSHININPSEHTPDEYLDILTTAIAGVAISESSTYGEAYARIDYLTSTLLDDSMEFYVGKVWSITDKKLKVIYE